jgi:hypothetical protein
MAPPRGAASKSGTDGERPASFYSISKSPVCYGMAKKPDWVYAGWMPWDLAILAISLFAFILSMMATLRCFFCTRSKWFVFLLVCVLVSGTGMMWELHRILTPTPVPDAPIFVRQPLTPL